MRTLSLFRISRLMPVALLLAIVASLVPVTPAYAANIVVNSQADTEANDGLCTLREAIIAAVANRRSGAAPGECAAGSAGVDSISFAANYTITLGSQLPYVTVPLAITGRGAGNTIIQAAATPGTATWRVFQVTSTGNLSLDGVTVRHGRCDGTCTAIGDIKPNAGGGIYNTGTLTVNNSTLSGNSSNGVENGGGAIFNNGTVTVTNSIVSGNDARYGGGIDNFGSVTITNSTFSQNSAGDHGGAISNYGGVVTVNNTTFSENTAAQLGGAIISSVFNATPRLIVTNSTFSQNSAYDGGGIANVGEATVAGSTFSGNEVTGGYGGGISNSETLSVVNSTLVGNSATTGAGGGISNGGILTMTSSTIAGNTASFGGWGIESFGSATLTNTIVVSPGLSCNGTIVNGGHNLADDDSCGWWFDNGSMSNTNPFLGPLADNGGPTRTRKLLEGSAAIDAGDPAACPSTDQRGVIRPMGAGCDIGAFEMIFPPGTDTVGVFRPSDGLLYLKLFNVTGFADLALNYGLPGDYPIVGDWDGNGTDTIGIYRGNTFYLRNSNTIGFAQIVFDFGQPGDQPIAGDWNGDGVTTIGVFRPSTAQFFLRNSNNAGDAEISFYLGNPGDVGIAGDWDSDGMDTTGVFRPSNGVIFMKNTNDTGFADIALNYGLPGDMPVMGDWNNDGIDTIGIYRNGTFFLRNSNTNGFAEIVFALGIPGDMPIAGNWDGVP